MDTSALKIFFLFLLSVFRIPEASCKNNKIKIIVPHKISVIHHHHSKITDLKPKKKSHLDFYNVLKSNQIHHQDEDSEEDVSEEGRFGHYLDEHDEEATQKGVAYYTIPAPEYSNPVRVYMKPLFLYNESFDRRYPPRYEYHAYDDYNYPEESYQGNMYHVRGFRYK